LLSAVVAFVLFYASVIVMSTCALLEHAPSALRLMVSGLVLDERYDLHTTHGNLMCKLFDLDFDFSGHFLFIGLEFHSSGFVLALNSDCSYFILDVFDFLFIHAQYDSILFHYRRAATLDDINGKREFFLLDS